MFSRKLRRLFNCLTPYRNLRCSWLLVSMFFSDIYLRFEGVFRYSVFRSNPFCKAHYGLKAKAPSIFRDHFFQFWMVQNGRIHQRLVVVFVGSCFSTFRKTHLVVVSRNLGIVHLRFPGHDAILCEICCKWG